MGKAAERVGQTRRRDVFLGKKMRFDETPLPQPAKSKTPDSTLTLEQLNRSRVKEFDDRATSETPEIFGYYPPIDRRREAEISIDELYYNPEFTSRELQTALRLLATCITLAAEALQELQAGHNLASHEATLSIQSLLPELFACRGLGDGYGALINSIQLALINRHGVSLDERQLRALKDIFEATRKAPFIRFDKARRLIRDFERHDFIVEPVTLQFLSNFFDEP